MKAGQQGNPHAGEVMEGITRMSNFDPENIDLDASGLPRNEGNAQPPTSTVGQALAGRGNIPLQDIDPAALLDKTTIPPYDFDLGPNPAGAAANAPHQTEVGRRLMVAYAALTNGMVPRDLFTDVLYAVVGMGATVEEALKELDGARFLFTDEQSDISAYKEYERTHGGGAL
jgi:hypothetical protein